MRQRRLAVGIGLALLAYLLWTSPSALDDAREDPHLGKAAPASKVRVTDPRIPSKKPGPEADQVRALWAQMPLAFEENIGQTAEVVRYFARGSGFDLFLTRDAALFASSKREAKRSVLRMQFVGGATVDPVATDTLPTKINYMTGPPSTWRTDVPSYREVRYPDVWPGIDVVFHGKRDVMEYDFEVQPGADVSQIDLAMDGADKLAIDATGNLVMTIAGRDHVHRSPRLFQADDSGPVAIAGHFVQRGNNRIGFEVPDRDPDRALLIDPEVVYVTDFFGGEANDNVFEIAVGNDGSATIAGHTNSLEFPGTGPASFQQTSQASISNGNRAAALIARISPDGSHFEWVTFLSGTGHDTKAWQVAVDDNNFAYVCGATSSPDFPTTDNAFDRTYGGEHFDAYVSVLTPQGSSLAYSSLFGGSQWEFFWDCTLIQDRSYPKRTLGNVYVAATGYTFSPDYPFLNAADTIQDGNMEAIVTVVDPSAGGVVYSGLLPGTAGNEIGMTIAARGQTLAIAGVTTHGPRPTALYWHHALEGDRGVAQLAASGGYGNDWTQQLTKTFVVPADLPTARFSARWGTEVDYDFLYVRGSADGGATWSTLDALDGFSAGFEERTLDLSAWAGQTVQLRFEFISDAFISDWDGQIDTDGLALDWVEISGNPRDNFETSLDGWIATDGAKWYTADHQYGPRGRDDIFVALVEPFTPTAPIRTASLGGHLFEEPHGIGWQPDGSLVVAGVTGSPSFPTTPNASDRTYGGGGDIFVTKLSGDLATLQASTYLGGNAFEYTNGIAVDATGRVVVSGFTDSTSFPLVDPIDLTAQFGTGGSRDYIVSILASDLSTLDHSSKFGGTHWDFGGDVDIGSSGDIYAIGRRRTDFDPLGASTQVFVLRLRP